MHKRMVCFPNEPVRTLLMPPAEENIWHRPFPPQLYSLRETENALFLRIYLFLAVITKGCICSPVSGDPPASTCCQLCISSYLPQSWGPFLPFHRCPLRSAGKLRQEMSLEAAALGRYTEHGVLPSLLSSQANPMLLSRYPGQGGLVTGTGLFSTCSSFSRLSCLLPVVSPHL